MSNIASTCFAPCHHGLRGQCQLKMLKKMRPQEWQCHETKFGKSSSRPLVVKNPMAVKPATYSSRISTDIPLYESPGDLFDQYVEDKQRVFNAMFPDKQRSQRLNEGKLNAWETEKFCSSVDKGQEEWRIKMLPMQFIFLTVKPVIDMRLRCKTGGKDYPPGVPQDIAKLLELDIMRWGLGDLDNVMKPSQFSLSVKGALYSDRRGTKNQLKGQLEMNVSFVLPPVLALIPEEVRCNVTEMVTPTQMFSKQVLTKLLEDMKQKVYSRLLQDYSEFKRESLNNARLQTR